MIRQLPFGSSSCPWYKDKDKIKEFYPHQIHKCCPILYHTLYPYFLGLLFGADYGYPDGECPVCCPAEKGLDLKVKMGPNDGKFKSVPDDWRDVIYAEVVEKHGKCPWLHYVGERIVFPTYDKGGHMCPGGFNNIFPFLQIPYETYSCINLNALRCPDWQNQVYYEVIR